MNIYLLIVLLIGIILPSYVGSRSIPPQDSSQYSVLAYGAAGDGVTDDSEAFMRTWNATCAFPAYSSPTMVIPENKKYLIHSVKFNGPCQSLMINVQIGGEILGPENPKDWKCNGPSCGDLIKFSGLTRIDIFGGGTINGQGDKWWNKPDIYRPTAMNIQDSEKVNITDLNFKDNPRMHLFLYKLKTVNVKNIVITAPEDSPNTDGIHIAVSTNVTVEDCIIGTGDDCISIVNASSNVKVRNISCGPGHGISIGSLGQYGSYNTVENVEIRDVVFTNTQNGARIKTWQGGKGHAKNITFDEVVCNNVSNPIIIDQFYCDHQVRQHCPAKPSAVQIRNVTYRNVIGTSRSKVAVNLLCSKSVPCRNIAAEDIYILSNDRTKSTRSSCSNAKGTVDGRQVPKLPCLKHRHRQE